MKNYKIIIIGAGPAGISTAIQLKRAGLNPLIISETIGGLVQNANLIENILGFPEGITAQQFIHLIKQQIIFHKISIYQYKVLLIEKKGKNYLIITESESFLCEILVLATGTKPTQLQIHGEEIAFNEKHLFYEIYPFLHLLPCQTVGIIGNGDVAYDYALKIEKKVKNIILYQRSPTSKALSLLQERIKQFPHIIIKQNLSLKKIILQKFEDRTRLNLDFDGLMENVDYLLVAIGREPNFPQLSSEIQLLPSSQCVDQNFYFVGDICQSYYRQIMIAAGDGIKTAMQIIHKEINKKEPD